MAKPKSASFTAAPLSLEANSRFSGFPGPGRRVKRGKKEPEDSERIQNLTSGGLSLQKEWLDNPEVPCPQLQCQPQRPELQAPERGLPAAKTSVFHNRGAFVHHPSPRSPLLRVWG